MEIRAHELCQLIIRPTLLHLETPDPAHERLLLLAALCRDSRSGSLLAGRLLGPWGMSSERHRQLWDHYLARDPDLASRIRGLASQHAFLQDPELELRVNLRYACAMAWVALRQAIGERTLQDDLESLALLWRQVFAPQGRLRRFYQQAALLDHGHPHVA